MAPAAHNSDLVVVAAAAVVFVEEEEEEGADQNKGSHKDMSCTLCSNRVLVEPKFGRTFLKKY